MSFWHVSLPKNLYWQGLSGIHTFATIFAFIEIIVKVKKFIED